MNTPAGNGTSRDSLRFFQRGQGKTGWALLMWSAVMLCFTALASLSKRETKAAEKHRRSPDQNRKT
jgi:hypothetical protein